MTYKKTKVFISYHHANDQKYKKYLVELNNAHRIFEDCSVHTGDISDDLKSKSIRTKIRDEYLRDSEVTILLCGTETRFRKHIDWELKSSMIDGEVNEKSGILVINLPTVENSQLSLASLANEKKTIHNEVKSWCSLKTKKEYEEQYPAMPSRIIDNLLEADVCISVVPWEKIKEAPKKLKWLIDETAKIAKDNNYNLSMKMKMKNHNP